MVSLKEFDFGRILALKEQGFSQQKISEMLTIPKTTVGDFLRRYKERGCFQRKSGSGRPSLLKSEHKTIFNDILIKKPKISAIKMVEELREKTGVSISSETIRRKLKKDGFIACSSLKRPLLSKKNKISRLKICTRWSYKPDGFWDDVIFSDECKFTLFNSNNTAKVWRKPGQVLDPRYLEVTLKHGGGIVMAWGCISSKGVGRLVFIDEIMDRFVYTRILANNLAASAEEMGLDRYIFQQDNDPKHTSAHVKGFFEENNIIILQWPSQSPYLNPMEHVWAHIKRELRGKDFKNRSELKEAIIAIWKGIEQQFITNIVYSMPKRVMAVLKANGGHTFY
jgi:transposase